MGASSQTVTYSTLAALALDQLSDKIADAISTSNAFFYFYKKSGNWESVTSGGRQLRKTILYQLQSVRPLGSYGVVNVNPVDGHTSTYWDWVQAAVSVSFSDLEEFQTNGSESIESIVKAKFQQAKASLDDFFSRAILQGQAAVDGTSVTTAYTSAIDGSYFIAPILQLAAYNPSASLTVGGIPQSTNSWWQNQYKVSSATSLAATLADLRTLHIYTQRGGGGKDRAPDFHVADERTYNVYEKALSLTHRNPDYKKADIPFENIAFKNKPVIPDQLMPGQSAQGTFAATTDISSCTYGTWFMGNSAFMGFTYDGGKSFKLGPNVRPNNQLVTSALMPVRGAHWTNNRRKLGLFTTGALATLEAATS
jgi:hypothetical protein